MTDNAKSSLVIASKKEGKQPGGNQEIEYQQVPGHNGNLGQLSDEEKQVDFNRQHEEYIKVKLERKKELLRQKRQQFGTSSSESEPSSQEEIQEPIKNTPNNEVKKSRGKIEKKTEKINTHPLLLELKKSNIQATLTLLDKEFEINKRTLHYSRIQRISITKHLLKNTISHKLRVGIGSDEDIVVSPSPTHEPVDLIALFVKMVRARISLLELKWGYEGTRCNPEEFGSLREDALIFDKIYKKSQYIGTWEERYVVIRKEGLESYRSVKTKPTMWIPLKQITELQTNFQIYKDLLVMKLHYNGTKTDFGLPIDQPLQWVKAFSNLLILE